MQEEFSIINETRIKIPRLPLCLMKDDILGKKYSLSIACVNESKSKELNKKYRGKDKPTNILSFSLSPSQGELVLCPRVILGETTNFDRNFREFFGFLVIHGMLHLKGFDHSSKMEKEEKKYDQKYFGGNRHRILNDKGRGGRISKRRKKS